jgi:hypothetical protein
MVGEPLLSNVLANSCVEVLHVSSSVVAAILTVAICARSHGRDDFKKKRGANVRKLTRDCNNFRS